MEDMVVKEDFGFQINQKTTEEPYGVREKSMHHVYLASASGSSSVYPIPVPPVAHRRSHSDFTTVVNRRDSSFSRLKTHMQRAWRWGSNSRDQESVPSFNPEILANQKRQWYQLHSKTLDHANYGEPTSLFEHFVVAGLHPETRLEAVEDAFVKRKKWEREMLKRETAGLKSPQLRAPAFPAMEPQILFKYPPGKRVAMRLKDLSAFCFPGCVKTQLLERTPSLSELNELVYGQEHLERDDMAFVFSLKVADNDTLYGVCMLVTEFVQREPGILGSSSPLSQNSRYRFLVSAPRCYCLLTRVPFFELHYEMLNSIIAQERLNRIMQFVSELSLANCSPSVSLHGGQLNGNEFADNKSEIDLMACAIPVESAVALTAAAAGIISDEEIVMMSPRTCDRDRDPCSPESFTASEASDLSLARWDDKRNSNYTEDCASESSEARSEVFEKAYTSCDNSVASPDIDPISCSKVRTLQRLGSFDTFLSPVRGIMVEDEDDDLFANFEEEIGDDAIIEWAKENKNELLQIICRYHSMAVPPRGSVAVFQPLDHLQPISYRRPAVHELGLPENFLSSGEVAEVNLKLAAAEEALALSIWTIATTCRVLSLENILTLLTGVLLEKQVVVVSSNLGVASAVVLSVVPLIRPFQWQSLFLPVLPEKMLDFLDAPVPFVVGLHQKPVDLKMKTSNLVHVNAAKNQVKTCSLPSLPQYKTLLSELQPIHAKLQQQSSIAQRHPVCKCSEVQAEAAGQFLTVVRRYLESLCSELRSFTITSVQSNNDRVSLLLKDSFIDSFPGRDKPFMKLLVDTQLFAVLSDSRLSSFESRTS